MNRNDPWLCKKCFFIKRKKQQSRVISFLCGKPPKQTLRGSFCFLLYDAVNQLAGFSKVLHNFLEILLHNGKISFRFIWQSSPLPGHIWDSGLLYDAVQQFAGFGKVLHNFLEILLHNGIKLLSFIWQSNPLPGSMDLGGVKCPRQCGKCNRYWPLPASFRNCSSCENNSFPDGCPQSGLSIYGVRLSIRRNTLQGPRSSERWTCK